MTGTATDVGVGWLAAGSRDAWAVVVVVVVLEGLVEGDDAAGDKAALDDADVDDGDEAALDDADVGDGDGTDEEEVDDEGSDEEGMADGDVVDASSVVVAAVSDGAVESDGVVAVVLADGDDSDVVVDCEVVPSTAGTGSHVSGDDGRTGNGSPGGGSVAAGFCSTTL